MQKRTTNYSFQKFGDVFYSVNHNAGHLIDYVENDFKITNKSFDSFYYSSTVSTAKFAAIKETSALVQ